MTLEAPSPRRGGGRGEGLHPLVTKLWDKGYELDPRVDPNAVNFVWPYLAAEDRFIRNAAIAALFVLLGALVAWTGAWVLGRSRWMLAVVPLLVAPAAAVIWTGVPELRAALRDHLASRSVLVMGPYLRAALPPNALVLSFMHSGAAAYYGRRPIVRLDIIAPELDGVIARLRAEGFRPLLLIDEVIESPHMQRIFPQSAYWDLDWAPRASFAAFGHIWLLDPADREAHRAGLRYPTDVLR